MGSFGPPQLAVLVAVAAMAAMCGFAAATAMRRTKRQTRHVFLFGALCGFVAGAVSAKWRGGRRTLLRVGSHSLALRHALAPAFRRIRSHGHVSKAHTAMTIATSTSRYTGHGPKTSSKDAVGGFRFR